jgi:serine phosphatase RsbU (regulator of sigma subunit)
MLQPNQAGLSYSSPDGNRYFAIERDSTSIGRSSDQDLVVLDSFVSRRHALINALESGYELVDQKSSHGTYLNGLRIETAVLKPGDTLQFGSINAPRYQFCVASDGVDHATQSLADNLASALKVLRPSSTDSRHVAHDIELLNFLISAARELNARGGINEILQLLLQLSIKLTGVDRGFVFLLENDQMHLALGLRADGTIVGEDSTVSRRAMQKAIESQSKFSVSDTLTDDSASAWASVVANSIRSIYCIPLRKHISPAEPNRLLGLLYLDSQMGAGHLSEIDHQVLDTVATEAATLLDNALLADAELEARLAAEELAIAATIHASLMSMELPTVSYAGLQARMVPCLAIGGDFYDAVALDNCLSVVIADVSGKGVPASIVAATLQGIIHAQMLTRQSLAEIATLVNQFLCTRKVGKYATMVLLRLWPSGLVEYINCGHIPPIVVMGPEKRKLDQNNLIVGLVPGAEYASAQCTLLPGERILLTTDGITEAENCRGEQFGDSSLDEAIQLTSLDAILAQVAKFQAPKVAQDDWTIVEIRYDGNSILPHGGRSYIQNG